MVSTFFQSKHLVQLVLTDETKWLEGGVPFSFPETVSTFGTNCRKVVVYEAIR